MSRRSVWAVIVGSSVAVLAAASASLATARSAAAPRCVVDQLTITVRGIPGGLDHVGAVVRFRNRGARCALRGYPGLDQVNGDGRVVSEAKRTPAGYLGGARVVRTVVLAPGATASALYEGYQGKVPGVASCPRYRFLRITAPNDRRSVQLLGVRRDDPEVSSPCAPQIHPVTSGRWGAAFTPRG